jgi:hypothetical protein
MTEGMVLWALRAPRELSLASLPGIAFGERRAAHDAEREREKKAKQSPRLRAGEVARRQARLVA